MAKPEVLLKLAKMLPLLGSDKSGEVVAAAAAITRALKKAALDWHEVVKWIESGQGKPYEKSNSRTDAWERSNAGPFGGNTYQGRRGTGYSDEQPADWKPRFNAMQYQGLAHRCLAADTTYLDAREMKFLKSATEWNSWATFKQERWIIKIANKLKVPL